jgi:hypothetical protein
MTSVGNFLFLSVITYDEKNTKIKKLFFFLFYNKDFANVVSFFLSLQVKIFFQDGVLYETMFLFFKQ